MLLNQLPRAADVDLARLEVPDRQPQREAPVQPGVRQEYVARRVDALDELFVESIERGLVISEPRRPRAETDDAERHRGETFEAIRVVDPAGKQPGETDVLAEHLADAIRSKMADH